MIPMLIVYFLRRMQKNAFILKLKLRFVKGLEKLKLISAVVLLSFCYAQADTLPNQKTFNIVKNNKVLGTITISRDASNEATVYHLKSTINANLLLKFCIKGEEKAIFKDGILVYSSVYRSVNNKVKSNHKLVYKKNKYLLNRDGSEEVLSLKPISLNLVSLYFKEPKSKKFVYCDNAGQMLGIESLGEGKYKVVFEKGKYNIFHYRDGKCIGVEANSKLFDVNLIPVAS
ncbi:DUF6134 family protein [Gaetbulibacter sp. M240]|uniref:DUF6134 family protein n=1 Tax=Gaetbulibacter sp. M240 TaxID=3126511 RepID=UPI00374FB016